MSRVWSAIVDMVEKNYTDKYQKYIIPYHKEKHLSQAIEDLLMAHIGVLHVSVTNVDVFESPGYDTGIVYAAWTERDGSLHTIDFQWELR